MIENMENKKEWWEDHYATKWWNTLTLDDQQTKMYHCCTGQEKGSFEFTMEDIVDIWEQELGTYMSDEMYLPIHYKSMIVKEPFFEGKGNHSVAKLEELCEQFKEYCHQQAIIKQGCMKHIVELEFGKFPHHETLPEELTES